MRRIRAREDIIREGDSPRDVNLVLEGWACRYKTLEDGRRQIIAFFIPGDMCDLDISMLHEMDHSIGALTALTFAEISRSTIDRLMATYPRIHQALAWQALVSAAVQREWTVNIGQRNATERLAHLFCELFLRLRAVGRTHGDICEMPVTQTELAEATGLTPVHVNRTLQDLRASGLIVLKGRELRIPDLAELQRVSLFHPNYLHLDHEGAQFDANGGEIKPVVE
ncbi:Crp/Fnr family transcriptional regulator [Sphingomonas oleivorans]|uniref:Crp/Fnr family transcriptional regulator n=1 Tax=Sphingomonas oleivorans TaxID=1735121 RepID=UPI001A9D4DEF|nr:Crp/Fnr family transcriptional regulator [Sphingomonas oleivorans]